MSALLSTGEGKGFAFWAGLSSSGRGADGIGGGGLGIEGGAENRKKIRRKENSSILSRNTIPKIYDLHLYPNPFNPKTKIIYNLTEVGIVKICIYNILGNKINSLLNGIQQTGTHEIYWDATDQNGKSVASGIYFLQIQTKKFIQTKKLFYLQ